MSNVVTLSGCPHTTAEEKVRDLMKFELKLATVSKENVKMHITLEPVSAKNVMLRRMCCMKVKLIRD